MPARPVPAPTPPPATGVVGVPEFDPGRGGSGGGGVRGVTDATRDGTADMGDITAPAGLGGSGGGAAVGVNTAADETDGSEPVDASAIASIAEVGVSGLLPVTETQSWFSTYQRETEVRTP